ncbi:MAG: ABC transporter permease, partial [Thermoplasmatota archaeon]
MDMKKYIGKRVFWGVVALFGLSIFIFYLARILPGDPVLMMVDPRTPQPVIDDLRRRLALDKPIYVQYFYWLKDVLSGNFGYSFYSRHSLTIDIQKYLPQSLELIALAGLIQIGGAFFIGISAGSN